MTRDEAKAFLSRIMRSVNGSPGYVEPLSELEIEGWLDLFVAMKLVSDN